ncbi:Fanconi anemia group M protein-like [Mya arenaria]|uniref:Fanconi anemia group M protein-like n=1 Tax=Mya arenaria TaxID=6604 RepID=UPI0022E7A207|nr:Fanconi anemia group M protein-like [Mya arenaria]
MKPSKQKTLFQSWGPRKTDSQNKPDILNKSNAREATPAAASTEDVIDLCGSFDDDDDELLCEAEESLAITHIAEPGPSTWNGRKIGGTSSSISINNQKEDSGHNEAGQQGEHDGNISLGVDGFGCSQISATQAADLPGYDRTAGKLWIYPTNYPVRDYQFNISQQALYKNTMVTLPTGLGKTFIAAVVMYNFYRWYPQGKVIFMAPTKPLVAQQIEACYNIMGIPQDHTAEMTGSMGPSKRERAWQEKRVYFLTPQVLTNDLSRGSCPANLVRCLVIDEAHKALGNHAYCQVVRELVKYSQMFRVLALSATPGSDIKAVQQVLTNLLISHIEIRTEESLDIQRYSHERRVEKVVLPLGDELTQVKGKYIQIMDVVVGRLKRQGVLYQRETTSFSKFLILKAREQFRQDPPERLPRTQYGVVEGDFALAMSLYHGYELLQLHGSRSLYNFLEGILTGEKSYGRTRTELMRNGDFVSLMEMLASKYKTPEGLTLSQVEKRPQTVGHPKMEKLQEIVLDHFSKHTDAPSRVMIFSQYRDSVQEITAMLHRHRPMVMVMSFIGQASTGKNTKGFTQKEQLQVMKKFREGGYNTLVSTCVGEEGLDIGDVDLIICFDAHKSPIRLVQRMGRTGRKREGRIFMLVTQGKEEQIYNQSQYSKRSIHKAILNGARSLHFYQHSPRMVPDSHVPQCHKMHITVRDAFKPVKKIAPDKTDHNQSKITSMLGEGSKAVVQEGDGGISLAEFRELEPWLVPDSQLPVLPTPSLMCLPGSQQLTEPQSGGRLLSLSDWSPWQTTLQETGRTGHSMQAQHLVQLMEFVQLQQSLDPDDDPYGLEMAAYLNEDDIVKERETVAPGSILKYCIPSTGKKAVKSKKKRGQGKFKSRLSAVLPKMAKTDEEDSDMELPEFNVNKTTGGRNVGKPRPGTLSVNDDSSDELPALDDDNDSGVENSIGGNDGEREETAVELSDNDEVDGEITSKPKPLPKEKGHDTGRKVIKSKAKSLERKMNETKLRKRKKSRHSSGHRSIVELIADSDSNDFDNIAEEYVTFADELQEINEHSISPKKMEISLVEEHDDSIMEVETDCALENSLEDLIEGSIRIRTPPPVEEAIKLCKALNEETGKIKVDLLALVEEWHRENADGKYIVYPVWYSKKYHRDSGIHEETPPAERNARKLSVPNQDLSVNTSLGVMEDSSPLENVNNNENTVEILGSKSKKSKISIGDSNTKEDLATNKTEKASALMKKRRLFKSPQATNLTKSPNGSSPESTNSRDSSNLSVTDNEDLQAIVSESHTKCINSQSSRSNEQNTEDINKDQKKSQRKDALSNELDNDNLKVNDDEDMWMNTGSFALDLDMDEMEEKEDELMQIFDEENSPVFSSSVKKSKNSDATDSVSKNNQGMASATNTVQDINELSENKKIQSLFDFCEKDDLQSTFESETDKNDELPLAKPFTETVPKSFEFDSWPHDDIDDDIFDGIKTPAVSKANTTSTQITFTQALHFVAGSTSSGSESLVDGHSHPGEPLNSHTYSGMSEDMMGDHEQGFNFQENIVKAGPCLSEKSRSKSGSDNCASAKSLSNTLLEGNSDSSELQEEIENSVQCAEKNKEFNKLDSALDNPVQKPKSLVRKSSSSSSDGVEMPEFDLGFDLDEDIIPPSPDMKVSQSQKSIRLSQAFNLSSRLSQSRPAKGESVIEQIQKSGAKLGTGSENQKPGSVKGFPKSRKSLKLASIDVQDKIEECEEESQSLLSDSDSLNCKLIGNSKKNKSENKKKTDLQSIPENRLSVDVGHENESYIPAKEIKAKKDIENKGKIEVSEPVEQKFNLSFDLLDTDLDDWIDSGAEPVTHDNKENKDNVNGDVSTVEDHPANKSQPPVATIAPISFSQKFNNEGKKQSLNDKKLKKDLRKSVFQMDDISPDVRGVPVNHARSKDVRKSVFQMDDISPDVRGVPVKHVKSKDVRKSVFKVDDLSSDFFDDSFDTSVFVTNDPPKTKSSTPKNSHSLKHNTSTPMLSARRKVQCVAPFRPDEGTPIGKTGGDNFVVTPPFTADHLNKVPQVTDGFHDETEASRHDSNDMSVNVSSHSSNKSGSVTRNDTSVSKEASDNDDSLIVVRKKKNVHILESPASQAFSVHDTSDIVRPKSRKALILSGDDDDADDFNDSFMMTQNKYIPAKKRKTIDTHMVDLDDDFEITRNESHGKSVKSNSTSAFEMLEDDDDFEESFIQPRGKEILKGNQTSRVQQQTTKVNRRPLPTIKHKKRRAANPFLEEEAELSEEDGEMDGVSSDEAEGSDLDTYDNSFIHDSQMSQVSQANNTDIHALYLKSVRSPVGGEGKFKLQYNHRNVDVFSQAPPQEESHYMEDSFCVDEECDDEWMLREEEEESSGEEPREVTLLHGDNSVLHTGRRKRRAGGVTSFMTSRQREIQVGRMNALDKIRAKVAGKTDRKMRLDSVEEVEGVKETEAVEQVNKHWKRNRRLEGRVEKKIEGKKSRIQRLNDSSSEEENEFLDKSEHSVKKGPGQMLGKGVKRARILLSSDSENDDDGVGGLKMFKMDGNVNSDVSAAESARLERLRKQREKQEEFRKKLKQSEDSKLTKLKDKQSTQSFEENNASRSDSEFAKPKAVNDNNDVEVIMNISSNQRLNNKPVILVDSREISSSQDIISDLRFKHDACVTAAQLQGCDYIVSNRMAIERKSWSEFSNGANRAKLVERMQHLSVLFDRPCLIIEKDRVKPGEEKSAKQIHWTKYVDRTLSQLYRSDVRVLFTENCGETGQMLADLCRLEMRKNMRISVPLDLNQDQTNKVKFFLSLPKISYIHALNLCHGYKSVSDFLASTASTIEQRGKMSTNRAIEVYNFVHREFDVNMLPVNYK